MYPSVYVYYVTGSLNAHKVYIVAKNRLMADRSGSRSSNAKSSSASQFEQSFRVQVSKTSVSRKFRKHFFFF